MSNLRALLNFDKRQIFRFFVDGHFWKKYRGWLGYEEREPGSVQGMLNGFSYIMDNFDLSSGVSAGYLKGLHKACSFGVLMKNPKAAPGDMRHLESYYLLHAGDVSIDSVNELLELRRGDDCEVFYDKEFAKKAEKLDAEQIHKALQERNLKFKPWYPSLTQFQLDSLDMKGSLADFYVTKHFIQLQYATKVDDYIKEFNSTIFRATADSDKLLCISRFVRKLELLHAFPDGNGRTYVPALMNHLLLYFGFFPAILLNTKLHAEQSTLEWVTEIERGIENTQALLANPSLNLYGYSIDEARKKDNDRFLELAKEFIGKYVAVCIAQRRAAKKSANSAKQILADCPSYSMTNANAADIQRFLRVLSKCNKAYVFSDDEGILYSDVFDPATGTFSQSLQCPDSLGDEDFAAFILLKHVKGNLVMKGSAVTRLDGLSNLTTISGDLILNLSRIENLDGLNSLAKVNNIELYGLPNLTSINGLNSLTQVQGRIYISTNSKLTSINGFNAIARIGASLHIINNLRLASIVGFQSLSEIADGSLELKSNDKLQEISGFSKLRRIGDTFSISNCPKLESLKQPSCLESVKNLFIRNTGISEIPALARLFNQQPDFPGYVKISSNHLTSIAFMRGLRSLDSSLYLHDNKLSNLEGLEHLEIVDASLCISLNQLNDLSQLSKLREINGVLILSNNRLTSLHGLESLSYVKTKNWGGSQLSIKLYGNTDLDGNISLKDIGALANLVESKGNLIIQADKNHKFEREPDKDSDFYTKNTVLFQRPSID